MTAVTIEITALNQFFLRNREHRFLAWSGSSFTRHNDGIPATSVKILTFPTYNTAEEYAVEHPELELDYEREQITVGATQPEPAIDPRTFRNELEQIAAIALPDLCHEMEACLTELPTYHAVINSKGGKQNRMAWIAAHAWEAGRRYGLLEAIAVTEGNMSVLQQATLETLEAARDRSLDLDPVAVTIGAPESLTPALTPEDQSEDRSLRIVNKLEREKGRQSTNGRHHTEP